MDDSVLKRISDELLEYKIDLAVVNTHYNVIYMTGANLPLPPRASWDMMPAQHMALYRPGLKPHLLISNMDVSLCGVKDDHCDLSVYSPYKHSHFTDGKANYLSALEEIIDCLCDGVNELTIGIEPSIPGFILQKIKQMLPGAVFIDVTGAFIRARRVKTVSELVLISEAVRLNDIAQEEMKKLLSSGSSEIELYTEVIRCLYLKAGGIIPNVGDIVSGSRIINGSSVPTMYKPKKGDSMIFDFSCCHKGYWADTTCTLTLGKVSGRQLNCMMGIKEAFNDAVSKIKPGCACSMIHTAAVNMLKKNGLMEKHYSGHSIGTNINDLPKFVPYDDTPIMEDMVFALEIGSYGDVNDIYGARYEKIVHVTANGCEVLSKFKDFV